MNIVMTLISLCVLGVFVSQVSSTFIYNWTCGFSSDGVAYDVDDFQTPPPVDYPMLPSKKKKGGKSGGGARSKIVNGRRVNSKMTFPWMAYIIGDRTPILATGFLIKPTLVVTAGHPLRGRQVLSLTVVIGSWANTQRENGYTITNVYTLYAPCTNTSASNCTSADLAILRVDRPASFVDPICLPDYAPTELFINKPVVLAGYGQLNISNPRIFGVSHALLYTTLKTMSNLECQARLVEFPAVEATVTDNMICARANVDSNAPKRDPCFGDAGAPLMYRSNMTGYFHVIGVTSVSDCGSHPQSLPVLFTRVTPYMNWIQGIINSG